MRRQRAALAAVFGLGLAAAWGAGATPVPASGSPPTVRSAKPIPVWVHVSAKRLGEHETVLKLLAVTEPGAICQLSISAGRQHLTLPSVSATLGQAGWEWAVAAGAPNGSWNLGTACSKHGRKGMAAIHPLVLIPGGKSVASVVAPDSLAIVAGRPTHQLRRQAGVRINHKLHGIGAHAVANPFTGAVGYCTYGAWIHAQWLGTAVTGNAADWYSEAKAAGLPTGTTPVVGAVFVITARYQGDPGHVGIVTALSDPRGGFSTAEMNGGSKWKDQARFETDEFNAWVTTHHEYAGPNMFFIYQPGTQPGALSQYVGHIVQWDGDKKSQKTAWLVTSNMHRNWIPDSATYNCLKSKGAPGPDVLSSTVLDKLTDDKGVSATCTSPAPPLSGNLQGSSSNLQGGGSPQNGGGNPQTGGGNPQTIPATTVTVSAPPTTPPVSTTAPSQSTTTPPSPAKDTTPPSTPGSLTASGATQNSLGLSWTASSDTIGVSGYKLFLNGSQVTTTASTSYTFTGLSCATSYTLGVAAYDAAGNTSATAPATASTAACPASTPTTYAETAGPAGSGAFTDYTNAGGTVGTRIAAYQTVQVTCKVSGFKVADGDPWWYRVVSSPWNGQFYASSDNFYNNGATSGSVNTGVVVDPRVPDC